MSIQRQRILGALVIPLAFGLGWAEVASAKPSFAITNGNSCRNTCHVNVETGRMQVVGQDDLLDIGTQLDGAIRGSRKVFQVLPGNTVTMSVEVLNGDALFALQLKRLEMAGQLNSLANFMTWLEDNTVGNPWTLQEDTNPPYFTKDDGNNGGLQAAAAGIFSFDLFIDAATPPDVYDVEFAIAGMDATEQLYYQDEHFYVEVVPEPAVGAATLAAVATLGLMRGARRARTRRRSAVPR